MLVYWGPPRVCVLFSPLRPRRNPTYQRTIITGDSMSFLIVLAALVFLMLTAYRGYSVILFAPIAALAAVAPIPPPSRRASPASSWRRWSAS